MRGLISRELDLRDLDEPVSVLRTRHAIDNLDTGEVLLVTTTDRETALDLDAWFAGSGNTLLQRQEDGGEVSFMIRKSTGLAVGRRGTAGSAR